MDNSITCLHNSIGKGRIVQKMIIGFDGSRAFAGEKTGTENYSFQLLKALAKIDQANQYYVYTRPLTQHSTAVESYASWPGNFLIKQIAWPRLWTQSGLAFQTFKDPLDVLFVPAHTLSIIRKPGLKTVVTVHDLGSEYLPGTHQLKQRLYLSFMQKVQLRGATKIIAVSKATKRDLLKRVGIDPRKVEVVYEGYDNRLFRPVKGNMLVNSLRQYGLEAGRYFLFVGTVQPRKNLERIIIALSEAIESKKNRSYRSLRSLQDDNLKLVIAGQRGWLAGEIYKLPKKLGIEDKVKFLGYVPEKDLPALYSQAIALLFPSLFEGFGLPILEAQACGCPVITSNISSMPEVAGKGAILVDPYSVDDIVKGMKKCQISNAPSGARSQMVKAGFENVKRFSWEKCARETLKVLEEVENG